MKKAFAYLLIALMLAAALSGCGAEDGMIYDPPGATENIYPSMRPSLPETAVETSPQVGSTGSDMTSPTPSANVDSTTNGGSAASGANTSRSDSGM